MNKTGFQVGLIIASPSTQDSRQQTDSLLYGEVDIFFQHFEGFTNIVQRVVQMKGYS
jgi:hypothetical protein